MDQIELTRLTKMVELFGDEKVASIESAKVTSVALSNANKVLVPHDVKLHIHE